MALFNLSSLWFRLFTPRRDFTPAVLSDLWITSSNLVQDHESQPDFTFQTMFEKLAHGLGFKKMADQSTVQTSGRPCASLRTNRSCLGSAARGSNEAVVMQKQAAVVAMRRCCWQAIDVMCDLNTVQQGGAIAADRSRRGLWTPTWLIVNSLLVAFEIFLMRTDNCCW